jgi:F1F0 ATPase subunit 2
MDALTPLGIGFALGLFFFGGLWLSLAQFPRGPTWLAVSSAARVGCAGLVFLALSRQGIHQALLGLVGFWLARWWVVGQQMAGGCHGTGRALS